MAEEDACVICGSAMLDPFVATNCGHACFCGHCIARHLYTSKGAGCPVCRAPVRELRELAALTDNDGGGGAGGDADDDTNGGAAGRRRLRVKFGTQTWVIVVERGTDLRDRLGTLFSVPYGRLKLIHKGTQLAGVPDSDAVPNGALVKAVGTPENLTRTVQFQEDVGTRSVRAVAYGAGQARQSCVRLCRSMLQLPNPLTLIYLFFLSFCPQQRRRRGARRNDD